MVSSPTEEAIADAHLFADKLSQLVPAMSADDLQASAIMSTLVQISQLLKENFMPYMPNFMPKLLKDSAENIDLNFESVIEDVNSDNKTSKILLTKEKTSMQFKMKGMDGEKKISLNTFALEAKLGAAATLKGLAYNLGKHFWPYTLKTGEILQDQVNYPYSTGLRKVACQAMESLLHTTPDEESLKTLFVGVVGSFAQAIQSRVLRIREKGINEFKQVKSFMKYLLLVMRFSTKKTFLSEAQLENLVSTLNQGI